MGALDSRFPKKQTGLPEADTAIELLVDGKGAKAVALAAKPEVLLATTNCAGKTWKVYAGNLPSVGYIGGDLPPLYLKHHDPFAYLSEVVNSSTQRSNIVPFTQLAADLRSGTLPNFGFIVPNAQNDAHDCPGGR